MNIFLAGATGVIGRPLVPLLRDAGHAVTGTSRSEEKASAIEVLGARGVVVDVFDARALLQGDVGGAARRGDPSTHRPAATSLDAGRPAEFEANARLRIEGTQESDGGGRQWCGVRARGGAEHRLRLRAGPGRTGRRPIRSTASEAQRRDHRRGGGAGGRRCSNTPGIDGVVLRYGRLYGPGTWYRRARPARARCMSTPRRMRRCWRSTRARRASTTSPRTIRPASRARCRARRRSGNLGFDAGFRLR